MADPNERDAKLIQYLQEAYGNEQELELALQADLTMTPKGAYQKRLKQHLKETKAHAKALERRIKKLGGGGTTVQKLVGKAAAAAKAPLHVVRGSGEQEKLLKNAKDQYTAEQAEISTYTALEAFATKVGDSETAKLAREIRRDEERMAKYLAGQLRGLANAVAIAEVPAAQRRTGKPKRRGKKTTAKKPTAKPAAKKATKSSAKKSASKKSSAKKSTARKSSKARARKKTTSRK